MEQPATPVAERVDRRGALDDSPALRRASESVAAEMREAEERLKRLRDESEELEADGGAEEKEKARRGRLARPEGGHR